MTSSMGFLSWRSRKLASDEADLVAHTYAVMRTLEVTVKHLIEAQTSARTFAMTGQDQLFAHYETARSAVEQDKEVLRHLTADNPKQQQRLDVLGRQLNAALGFAERLVANRRQMNAAAGTSEILETEKLMDGARVSIQEMRAEETRLLDQRAQKTRAARSLTDLMTALGTLLGVSFLVLAGFAINREIGVSARGRAQLRSLNTTLEQRVAERTAALGESEGRLAGVIQSAMDAVITLDDQQRILLFNVAAERMFHCPAAEALGQPIARFIPQRFQAAHAGHIQKFSETGVTNRAMGSSSALWALRADGEEFQIEASISQVGTAGKKLFTVILRDVTERSKAEQALRQSFADNERALKELADQKFALDQHAIVAVTDVQGTIAYVNDSFAPSVSIPRMS